jgi:hypothetical protein
VILDRLHEKFNVPLDYLHLLSPKAQSLLLRTFYRKSEESFQGTIILSTFGGLGARLLALSDAMELATATNRVLLLDWPQDKHCMASFDQLFLPSPFIGAVVSGLNNSLNYNDVRCQVG